MNEPKPVEVVISGNIDSMEITELTCKITYRLGDKVFKEETFSRKVNIPVKSIS